MTLTETGGKVITSITDQFKSQPLCLALLIMNGALLFFIYHEQNTFNARAREIQAFLTAIIERCTPSKATLPELFSAPLFRP